LPGAGFWCQQLPRCPGGNCEPVHQSAQDREEVKTTNANVSQHLNILRSQGIIDYRKDANFIYNRINDPRIIEMMQTMQTLFCPSVQ